MNKKYIDYDTSIFFAPLNPFKSISFKRESTPSSPMGQ